VSGAIQFSNGSAFASDASNLFWDDTNNRLGIGTATPTSLLNLSGSSESTPSGTTGGILNIIGSATNALVMGSLSTTPFGLYIQGGGSGVYPLLLNPNGSNVGIATTNPTAKLHIKGSGSTAATTSFLIQDSVGTDLLNLRDDGYLTLFAGSKTGQLDIQGGVNSGIYAKAYNSQSDNIIRYKDYNGNQGMSLVMTGSGAGALIINSSGSPNASAVLQADSTTKGFLPPRMTNSERTSISSPAVGLMVYCTDAVEGLYINKSTGWTLVI
jgi:hypothetical protein